MNGYLSKCSGPWRNTMFQMTQMMINTVCATRYRPVPRKRATRSVHWPNASGSTEKRGPRRSTRGWSSRRRASAIADLAHVVAPVLGQQVVEHVVDRHGAEQPVV